MGEPGYSDALRVLRDAAGGDLQHVLDAACEPVPAWDPVVYLADFSGSVLFPLADGVAEEDVAGSMAGRAFTHRSAGDRRAGRGGPGVGPGDGAGEQDRGAGGHRRRTRALNCWSRSNCSACSPGWPSPPPRG